MEKQEQTIMLHIDTSLGEIVLSKYDSTGRLIEEKQCKASMLVLESSKDKNKRQAEILAKTTYLTKMLTLTLHGDITVNCEKERIVIRI